MAFRLPVSISHLHNKDKNKKINKKIFKHLFSKNFYIHSATVEDTTKLKIIKRNLVFY